MSGDYDLLVLDLMLPDGGAIYLQAKVAQVNANQLRKSRIVFYNENFFHVWWCCDCKLCGKCHNNVTRPTSAMNLNAMRQHSPNGLPLHLLPYASSNTYKCFSSKIGLGNVLSTVEYTITSSTYRPP